MLVRLAAGWGSKQFEKAGGRGRQGAARQGERRRGRRPRTGSPPRASWSATSRPTRTLVKAMLDADHAAGRRRNWRPACSGRSGPARRRRPAGLILERLPGLTPAARAAGIGVLLGRPEWTRALLAAIDAGKLQLADLSLDQKQALADHPDAGVRRDALAMLQRGGGAAQRRPAEGDRGAARRRRRRRATRPPARWCSRTSAPSATRTAARATTIGPDLTGMAVHPKEELLVHILDPRRSVEGNFRLYRVLDQGRAGRCRGLLASRVADGGRADRRRGQEARRSCARTSRS